MKDHHQHTPRKCGYGLYSLTKYILRENKYLLRNLSNMGTKNFRLGAVIKSISFSDKRNPTLTP